MKNQTDKQSKTKEELNALKKEVEAMNKKLAELNGEELGEVIGGQRIPPKATTADIKVGDSVFASDKNYIERWGIVESIFGDTALIRFDGGSMLYEGKITQLEPNKVWTSIFYLSGF